ncbi:hypothetical protein D3C79_914250 [compost metagenome]
MLTESLLTLCCMLLAKLRLKFCAGAPLVADIGISMLNSPAVPCLLVVLTRLPLVSNAMVPASVTGEPGMLPSWVYTCQLLSEVFTK